MIRNKCDGDPAPMVTMRSSKEDMQRKQLECLQFFAAQEKSATGYDASLVIYGEEPRTITYLLSKAEKRGFIKKTGIARRRNGRQRCAHRCSLWAITDAGREQLRTKGGDWS